MTLEQAEKLRKFRYDILKLFHTLHETDKAKLGICENFFAVKQTGRKKTITRFITAEEAIKFYNENNK